MKSKSQVYEPILKSFLFVLKIVLYIFTIYQNELKTKVDFV